MNKNYIFANGSVFVNVDGDKRKLEYRDNINELLVSENEVAYLVSLLVKDERTLNKKVEERAYRLTSYKKMVPMMSGVALGTGVCCSVFFSLGTDELFFKAMGSNLVGMIPGSLIVANALTAIELLFRPSLSEIAGYEEMVKFEQEYLIDRKDHLDSLRNDTRNTKGISNINSDDVTLIKVDDSAEIRYIKQMRDLRYSFGANRKIIMEMSQEDFVNSLRDSGKDERVVSDFIIFVEQEKNKAEAEKRKKMN